LGKKRKWKERLTSGEESIKRIHRAYSNRKWGGCDHEGGNWLSRKDDVQKTGQGRSPPRSNQNLEAKRNTKKEWCHRHNNTEGEETLWSNHMGGGS